jgi:ribokinase
MIYVLGSINMDFVARVSHLPKVGETLSCEAFYTNLGGKGANQAVAIAKLGETVKMIGKVGKDANGVELKSKLSGFGVDTTFVTEADAPSGLAMITVHNGNNSIILNMGANECLSRADADEGLKDAKEGDILVMQLEVPVDTVEYAAKLAKEKGMIVILNPAPAKTEAKSVFAYANIVAPNETETELFTGVLPSGDVELALAVKKLRANGANSVLITLGSSGSAVIEGQTITYVPARKVKAVDTTSAGDTFMGAVAVKLNEGKTLLEAAQFATYASSITVQREGAAQSIPTLAEVQALWDEEHK